MEVMSFGLTWPSSSQLGTKYFARSCLAGDIISIDIAVGETNPPNSGFRYVGNTSSPLDANRDGLFATVGPLSPGNYILRITLGTFALQEGGSFSAVCPVINGGFPVYEQSGSVTTAAVMEFYNAQLDHYFITQSTSEIADLDAGVHPGWVRTGQVFSAYVPFKSDARGNLTCRWYARPANLDTHFFSSSAEECKLQSKYEGIWTQETDDAFEIALPDIATGMCGLHTISVYRLWNRRPDSNHRYTTDLAVRAAMIAKGYTSEGYGPDGVAMCAPAT
jgi:hypothetical protein